LQYKGLAGIRKLLRNEQMMARLANANSRDYQNMFIY
jgi:hypothetical protein